MQATEIKPTPARPFTEAFRSWVQDSLVILNTSALSVGRAKGLGKNTLGDFLRDPDRDIHLETAHGITCTLREMAAEKDKVLPRLRVQFDALPAQPKVQRNA